MSDAPAPQTRPPVLTRLRAFDEAGMLFAVVAMILIIGVPNPEFLSGRSAITVLRQCATFGIVAFGMVYLIAMTEIDLSVGGIYAASTTAAAVLITAGVDPWLAAAATLLFGAGLGALNGAAAVLLGVPVIIVSLGTLSAYRGLNLWMSDGRAIMGMPREHAFFRIFGGDVLGVPTSILVFGLLGIVLHLVFAHTRYGATVRAIGSNAKAAEFIGLRITVVKIAVTALLGALCAVSGLLTLAFFKTADPSLGVGLELTVIAAVVIGGTSLAGGQGTILGTVLGVILIVLISSGLVFFGVDANFGPLITGLVILSAIAFDRIAKIRRARP